MACNALNTDKFNHIFGAKSHDSSARQFPEFDIRNALAFPSPNTNPTLPTRLFLQSQDPDESLKPNPSKTLKTESLQNLPQLVTRHHGDISVGNVEQDSDEIKSSGTTDAEPQARDSPSMKSSMSKGTGSSEPPRRSPRNKELVNNQPFYCKTKIAPTRPSARSSSPLASFRQSLPRTPSQHDISSQIIDTLPPTPESPTVTNTFYPHTSSKKRRDSVDGSTRTTLGDLSSETEGSTLKAPQDAPEIHEDDADDGIGASSDCSTPPSPQNDGSDESPQSPSMKNASSNPQRKAVLPRHMEGSAIDNALREELRKLAQSNSGYVYVYRVIENDVEDQTSLDAAQRLPLLKIGMVRSLRGTKTRAGDIRNACNLVLEHATGHQEYLVANPKRVEELAHLELSKFREFRSCENKDNSCNTKNHKEFFRVPEDVAVQVVERWYYWMVQNPYHQDGRLNDYWGERLRRAVYPDAEKSEKAEDHGIRHKRLLSWTQPGPDGFNRCSGIRQADARQLESVTAELGSIKDRLAATEHELWTMKEERAGLKQELLRPSLGIEVLLFFSCYYQYHFGGCWLLEGGVLIAYLYQHFGPIRPLTTQAVSIRQWFAKC